MLVGFFCGLREKHVGLGRRGCFFQVAPPPPGDGGTLAGLGPVQVAPDSWGIWAQGLSLEGFLGPGFEAGSLLQLQHVHRESGAAAAGGHLTGSSAVWPRAPCGKPGRPVSLAGGGGTDGLGSGLVCILVDSEHKPQAQVIPEGLLPDASCDPHTRFSPGLPEAREAQ